MNDKDKKYMFDDETDDNEIAEYVERNLDELFPDSIPVQETRSKSVKQEDKERTGRNSKGRNKKSRGRKLPVFDFYEKNKMPVLWGALGVLIIVLIISLIITNVGKDDNEENEEVTTETETTTEEATTEPATDADTLLAEAADSEYNKLFEKYFQNSFVLWNETALAECYENMQNVSATNYSYLNKYIEGVQDIVCYVAYETEDNKQIVYVTYNMKFKNINTVAPAMDTFILAKTDSGYKLHNFEVGEELDLYTSKIQENPHYLELKSNINNQLGIALGSDADLKKVYDALKNVGTQ